MSNVDAVREKIASFLRVSLQRVQADTRVGELGADSMTLVELVIELQEDFDVRLVRADLEAVDTVSDLAAVIERARA